MKKFKFGILAGLLVLLSVSAFAEGRLPVNIQTAFQKLYPQATDVEWEQMAGCYVAEFIADGQEVDLWFNKQAEWVMTETDVESLEKSAGSRGRSIHEQYNGRHEVKGRKNHHLSQTSHSDYN